MQDERDQASEMVEFKIGGYTMNEYMAQKRKYAESRAKDIIDGIPKEEERVRLGFEAVQKLLAAGFEVYPYNPTYVRVTCKVEDLPRVYKAIGRVKLAHKNVEDAKKRIVEVVLHSERYPDVMICYMKKLPRDKAKARCKIVTQRSSYTTLVCER